MSLHKQPRKLCRADRHEEERHRCLIRSGTVQRQWPEERPIGPLKYEAHAHEPGVLTAVLGRQDRQALAGY